ncbi:MAG: hypothetical protein G01um10143_740 [Parcubacteria group bacterium Gr01-1014_3]|nr:MAG: hypothetical protein G01um10143_740 [Parcubacteria group bacterium Gr01-1014_3]
MDLWLWVLMAGLYLFMTSAYFGHWISREVRSADQRYDLKRKYRQTSGSSGAFENMLSLPVLPVVTSVENLIFIFRNLTYYLNGGRQKQIDYARQFIDSTIQRLKDIDKKNAEMIEALVQEGHDRASLAHAPNPDAWFVNGRNHRWDLRDVQKDNNYENFSNDWLMTPLGFWVVSGFSALGLLFWPVTLAVWWLMLVVFISGIFLWFLLFTPLYVIRFVRDRKKNKSDPS